MRRDLITLDELQLDAVLCIGSKLLLETIFPRVPDQVLVVMAIGSVGCIGLPPIFMYPPCQPRITFININRTWDRLYSTYAVCVKHIHIMIWILLLNNLDQILPYGLEAIVVHSFLLTVSYMYNYFDKS